LLVPCSTSGDLAIDEEVVEGLQAAHLEGAARDGAAGEHQRDLRVAQGMSGIALSDQRQAHTNLPVGRSCEAFIGIRGVKA
jgi:hypothetical protein